MYTHIMCIYIYSIFSERLSKAYITNPRAPVRWITGPHRATLNEIKNQGKELHGYIDRHM